MRYPSPQARPRLSRTNPIRVGFLIGLALVLSFFVTAPARARQVGPVYPDDSVAAREGLARAQELASGGNVAEAARVIQSILISEGDRVIEAPGDANLFFSVRRRAHEVLLANPAILEKYRSAESATAQAMLESGQVDLVEHTRLLTPAGFEAALRLTQEHLESARFEAARMTLEQLDAHPDRADRRLSQDAATLALSIARYLDRDDVRAWAERWAAAAALPAVGGQPVRPGAAIVPPPFTRPMTPFDPAAELGLDELVRSPLQSAWLSNDAEADAADITRFLERQVAIGRRPELTITPWTMPAVRADTVFTNDGRSIAAWDRFTLQLLWRVTPDFEIVDENGQVLRGREARRSSLRPGSMRLEDTTSVTLAGPVVLAATGLAIGDARDGDPRIHALDADTGRILWSCAPGVQDPQLGSAYVRGPIALVGDTAVVAMRKPSASRRVSGTYLVGIDAWTGTVRWSRLLGSAGWVFYQRSVRASELIAADRGVVYRADDLGMIAAIQAHDGRVLWLRRYRADVPQRAEASPPFTSPGPVVDGSTLIMLSPMRDEVIRVDAATGAVLAHRSASAFEEPLYLLRVGDQLAAVGDRQILFAPINGFDSGPMRRAGLEGGARFLGRAVAAGSKIVVPVADGLAVIDPSKPDSLRTIDIENTGNALFVPGHLLVADMGKLHSYLVWDTAEHLLRKRMDAARNDPRPALTFVELAYRGGRAQLVPFAADRALDAIDADPMSDPAKAARHQLLTSLQAMVTASLDPAPPEPPTRAAGLRPPAAPPVISDPKTVDEILARIGRLADLPAERVDHLMSLGRFRASRAAAADPGAADRAASAAEAYQRVLEDPLLAATTWRSPRGAVRADIEATRRLRELVTQFGRPIYRVYDAEAVRARADLAARPDHSSSDYIALAKRFPASSIVAELWLAGAQALDRAPANAAAQHVDILDSALAAAEWSASVGDAPARAALAESGGRLVRALQAEDRFSAAAQLLDRLTRDHPDVRLSVRGIELDPRSAAEDIRRRIAGLQRRARIGSELSGQSQVLEGWKLVRPLNAAQASLPTEHVVMISNTKKQLALWGAQGGGELTQIWTRPWRTGGEPTLLALDTQAAYLFWPTDDGAVVERVDAVGGRTRWKTAPFDSLFPTPAEGAGERPTRLSLPNGRGADTTDILPAFDPRTLALVERSGRAAAFDLESGKTLWSGKTTLTHVYDIAPGLGVGDGAAASATLILAGAAPRQSVPGEAPILAPVVAACDLRTGALLHQTGALGREVRWLRTGPSGEVVIGMTDTVASLNLATGKPVWELSDTQSRRTDLAWIFGDRLFVLGEPPSRNFWSASLKSGTRTAASLDPKGRLEDAPIRAAALTPSPQSAVVFSARRGIMSVSGPSEIAGRDALDGAIELTCPEVSEQLAVAVELGRTNTAAGSTALLHFFEMPTCRIVQQRSLPLQEDPRELMILDGLVLISTDSLTIALPAPAGK